MTFDESGDQYSAARTAAGINGTARLMRRSISRRSLMGGALGAGMLALLAACGSDDDDPVATSTTQPSAEPTPVNEPEPDATETTSTGASEDDGWEFTDDRGITITLDARPSRVVTYSTAGAALWDFGVRPLGIFGPQRNPDGSQNEQAGEIDLDAVESIGEDASALDLEMLVTLAPDLIIGLTYDNETIWPLDADVAAQIEAIAPIAGMSASGKPADEMIARWEELAVALGADLDAPQVAEDRERFEQATEDLQAAIAEKPELTTLFVAGSDEMLYVGNANVAPDLLFFSEAGLTILGPEDDNYFESLSWEQAGKYPADLVLNDSRGSWYSPEQLAAQATWAEHPAQQAGQIGEWLTVFAFSHRGFAKVIEELTATIEESEVLS